MSTESEPPSSESGSKEKSASPNVKEEADEEEGDAFQNEVKELLLATYNQGMFLLKCGKPVDAFAAFKPLLPYLGTDAVIWLRVTECCIAALFEVQLPVHSRDFVDINRFAVEVHKKEPENADFFAIQNKDPPLSEEELDKLGISWRFAELAISSCLNLMKDHPSSHIGIYAMLYKGLVSTKRGFYRFGGTCVAPFLMNRLAIAGELQMCAELIKLECLVRRGCLAAAFKFMSEIKARYPDSCLTEGRPPTDIIAYDKCIVCVLDGRTQEAVSAYNDVRTNSTDWGFQHLALGAYVYALANNYPAFEKIVQDEIEKKQDKMRKAEEQGTKPVVFNFNLD